MLLPDYAYWVRMFVRSSKGDHQMTTELGREGYLISSVTAGYLCRKDHQWRAMQLGNFAQEMSRFLHWKQQTREREGICEFKLSTVL